MTRGRRIDAVALGRAFDLAREQVADGTVPFAIVAVATADAVVRVEAFAGPRAPAVDLDSICLLASITKPVVATAIVQLVAEGRVALEDGIDRFVPDMVAPGRPRVTLWHLLTHTAGIPDYDPADLLATRPDRRELLRRAASADLRFEPGSRYEYVSSSFELLAAVIERVRGEHVEAALRDTLLGPLGMPDTTFAPTGSRFSRVAPLAAVPGPGSAPTAGSEPAADWAPRATSFDEARYFAGLALAGGGLFATAADLVRFGRALLRGGELDGERVLPPRFVELMTREHTAGVPGAAADPLRSDRYGLGWGKPNPLTSPASPAAFGHGGATCTRLWVDPGHDLVFVYLSGVMGTSRRPIDAVLATVYAAIRDE